MWDMVTVPETNSAPLKMTPPENLIPINLPVAHWKTHLDRTIPSKRNASVEIYETYQLRYTNPTYTWRPNDLYFCRSAPKTRPKLQSKLGSSKGSRYLFLPYPSNRKTKAIPPAAPHPYHQQLFQKRHGDHQAIGSSPRIGGQNMIRDSPVKNLCFIGKWWGGGIVWIVRSRNKQVVYVDSMILIHRTRLCLVASVVNTRIALASCGHILKPRIYSISYSGLV